MNILGKVVTTVLILLFIACLVSCTGEQTVSKPPQAKLYIHGPDGEVTAVIPRPGKTEDMHIYVSED